MMGMEKMLAGMLGVTPEEMQATIKGVADAATNGVAALEKIAAQNDEILRLLKLSLPAAQIEGSKDGGRNDTQ